MRTHTHTRAHKNMHKHKYTQANTPTHTHTNTEKLRFEKPSASLFLCIYTAMCQREIAAQTTVSHSNADEPQELFDFVIPLLATRHFPELLTNTHNKDALSQEEM